MHRYVAFAWDHRSADKAALARLVVQRLQSRLPDWQCALTNEGLQVYYTGPTSRFFRAYPLDQQAGVLLGKVFRRRMEFGCHGDDVQFNDHESHHIRKTNGRHLTDRYWGRYVAFLQGKRDGQIRVLRDPSGAMPCLWTTYRGIDVFFSDISDCATLELINATINWDHITAFLTHYRLITQDTGLLGVRQVHAGECVTTGTDASEPMFYWSPDRIHDARTVEDRPQAMIELKETVKYCVSAWASCYDNILHSLSGGLDSSIVLACLSEESIRRTLVCQNYYTESAVGDERVFAQKAASRAGIELVETPLRGTARAFEEMFDSKKLASPTLTHLVTESVLVRDRLVKERGVEAVFSGQGGDHFFQQVKTPLVAADYAARHGLRPEILSVIADTARLTRKPIWSIMRAVLSAGLCHRYEDPYFQERSSPLLSTSARESLKRSSFRHPWVVAATHLPPNKLSQIALIVDTQNFYCQPSRYADTVHPLISQPIIELVLQIPSYVLTYGGTDRALVRAAFSDSVPIEITRRTTKSGTTSVYIEMLAGNLPYLKELMLDGVLVREGILDRRNTEKCLTETELICDTHLLFPMVNAIFAEYWLRTWVGDGQRAAA